MIRLLRSGKFWLKSISFGSLAVLLAVLSLYLGLHQLFSPERMHALADAAVAGTGRSVRFDSTIGRSWLPRPTATLRNVVITKPGNNTAAVMVKEMRIGLAWSSLWQSRPEIEKWLLRDAEAELLRDTEGRWSLQDLWEKPGSASVVNRLQLENGRINIHLPDRSYSLHNFNANIGRPDGGGRRFSSNGIIESHLFEAVNWKTGGVFLHNGEAWQVPQLRIEADTERHGRPISLSADSSLSWQPQAHTLDARNIRLRADSPFHNLHLTAESPLLHWSGDHIQISRINGVYTADNGQTRWNGSFMLAKTHLRPSVASIGEFESNNNLQTDRHHTTVNLAGSALWQQGRGLNLDDLKLTTLQDSLGGGAQSRFNAQLGGTLRLQGNRHWQAVLQGTFDRQPADIRAAYSAEPGQTARLGGTFKLQKLALAPYWNELQTSSASPYPDWLVGDNAPEIDAQISIGSLSIPGLQLDNLDTRLFADRQRITFSNFKAGLYGGMTEGGFSIANTRPLSYHLQQNATDVQIRPLLQDLFGNNNISGNGQAVIDLSASGSDREALTHSLKGSLQLSVADGAWIGFDLNNILQRASGNGNARNDYDNSVQTPFRRFNMLSEFTDGIGYHENVELVSDYLEINATGHTDFNTRTLSENLLIHNARNPQAKPVPLKISGAIDNPSVTIDFQRLTYGLSTPAEKQRALADTLREQWQWLNPRNGNGTAK
ncbi:MAG: AsmA family protein [Neisseria sp.]|nr:AsmA family protein [Neisseria sp.]